MSYALEVNPSSLLSLAIYIYKPLVDVAVKLCNYLTVMLCNYFYITTACELFTRGGIRNIKNIKIKIKMMKVTNEKPP